MKNVLQQINEGFAELNDRVLESVVQIQHLSSKESGSRSHGAGAICRADGLIVTNAHVVAPAHHENRPEFTVVLRRGEEYAATVQAIDTEHDLAVLHIAAENLPALPFGDSRRLRPGELVFALGFPWGIKAGATIGVIIGTGNTLPEIGDRQHDWIAASLHLRPGHSGGPMVDSQGRLVGINTIMNGPDVGVAVPVHSIQDFMHRLQAQETDTRVPPAMAPVTV